MIKTLFYREYCLVYRAPQTWIHLLVFFMLLAILFPLSTNADPKTLQLLAPGVIWIAALLSNFLSLPTLFAEDEKTGCLDRMLLSPVSLSGCVAIKMFMHWALYSLPLVLASAVVALLYQLSFSVFALLFFALILGTGIFQCIATVLAALTVSLKQSGVLLALLIFPLYVPIFILGTNAVLLRAQGFSAAGPLAWLAILFLIFAWVAPFISANCLRLLQR